MIRNKGKPYSDILVTYVDQMWSISHKGTLYVKTASNAVSNSASVVRSPAMRVGRIASCVWSSKLTTSEASYANVFKFTLESADRHQASSGVDATDTVVVLKEDNFALFEHDKRIKEQIPQWQSLAGVTAAHTEAIGNNGTRKKGNWLKKVLVQHLKIQDDSDGEGSFSVNVPDTQASTSTNSAATVPTAINFGAGYSSSSSMQFPISPIMHPNSGTHHSS